ncbi:MAG: hypothetical protein K2X07_06750 [Caulobacteraceae bacterium]|nr:hypothetical protein [Caulobacteraceae bacterium]
MSEYMPLVIAAICFLAAMWAVHRANSLVREMVRLINAEAEPDRQLSPVGWHPAKGSFVMQRYAALYPTGRLRQQYRTYVALAALGMLGALAVLAAS